MASVKMPEYDPEHPERYAREMEIFRATVNRLNDPGIFIKQQMEKEKRLQATPGGRWSLALNNFKRQIKGQEGQKEKLIEWEKNNPNPEPLTAEDYGDKD
jgi:hypothetical protein